MLFINFNSASVAYARSFARAHVPFDAHERAAKSCVSLIAAPVYDQDTTQVAEYDGGMYITLAFTAPNQSTRAPVNVTFILS